MADTGYYFAYDYIKNKIENDFTDNQVIVENNNINIVQNQKYNFENIEGIQNEFIEIDNSIIPTKKQIFESNKWTRSNGGEFSKGEVIADSRLTILDRPDNVDGFGYSLFDDEGTPAAAIELIKAGTLTSLIHNSMTASYFETRSTGHATRGPRSTLGVGLHQLEIAPGDAEDADLHAGEYLILTDLTGMHSGANAISGEFSFGASGYLCENGERIQPVRNITVAGNFYQMLKNISLIGNQQHWNWQRSAFMPSIRFADVAISG